MDRQRRTLPYGRGSDWSCVRENGNTIAGGKKLGGSMRKRADGRAIMRLACPQAPPAAMNAAGTPRVFLVDDHHLFRAGVRSELGDAVEVVGEADEVPAAIELIAERLPDVVLLDVHMPGGGGKAVIEAIKPIHPSVKFLALSVSDAPEDVIAVIRAGARGYVTKTISGPELIDAVLRVAGGDAVFSPRLAGFVLDAFAS